jgi:hypothetical protein
MDAIRLAISVAVMSFSSVLCSFGWEKTPSLENEGCGGIELSLFLAAADKSET